MSSLSTGGYGSRVIPVFLRRSTIFTVAMKIYLSLPMTMRTLSKSVSVTMESHSPSLPSGMLETVGLKYTWMPKGGSMQISMPLWSGLGGGVSLNWERTHFMVGWLTPPEQHGESERSWG